MGYRVIFTVRADRDLAAAIAFLGQNSREAAERIGFEIVAVARSLTTLPRRGGRVRRRPGLRKLTHRDYLLFYQVNEALGTVEIVRIWDGRQDPETLRLP